MSDRRTVARVRIVGEEYTVRTDASESHTRSVAEHVDRTIRSIINSGAVIETHKAAILAALQITDALFRERAEAAVLEADLRGLTNELKPLLPPAKRGDDGAGVD